MHTRHPARHTPCAALGTWPLPLAGLALGSLAGLAFPAPARAAATFLGPIAPYAGFADSPFDGQSFTYFYLVKFSDVPAGATQPGTPGVTASAGYVDGPGSEIDSVDGGPTGNAGHSFFSGDGATGITFAFSAAALGQLPTDAGIAWTDGDGPITFQAFGPGGASLGSVVDTSGLRFSTGGDSDPSNYRFFGVTDPDGISAISISNTSGGIETDHLQYGLAAPAAATAVPEPAPVALLALGLPCLGWAAARRRRAGGRPSGAA